MSLDDPLSYLTPDDRAWLHAHGWIDHNEAMVKLDSRHIQFRVIRLYGDNLDAYRRDINHPPYTLLAHTIRNMEGGRVFTTVDQAAKSLDHYVPPSDIARLAATACALNGLAETR